MEEAWARSLRDQCVAAGVAFHFKQWGAHLPAGCDGAEYKGQQILNASNAPVRIGKHAAGRLLDGRTWDEYPEVRQ
jgi:protein gp37